MTLSSPMLRESEAAAILSVAPRTLSKWRLARKGPRWIKMSGSVRYRVTDLELFIEESGHDA